MHIRNLYIAFTVLALMVIFGPSHTVSHPVSSIKPIEAKTALNVPKMDEMETKEFMPYHYAPMGTYPNNFAPRNCTSYVASRKGNITWSGNANVWAAKAKAQGKTVSNIPVPGSIAQHSGGSAGHVALVLRVEGDKVLIAEQNYDYRGSVRETWKPVSAYVYIWI